MPSRETLPADVRATIRKIERHIMRARREISRQNWSRAWTEVSSAQQAIQSLPEGVSKETLTVTLNNLMREVMGLPPEKPQEENSPREPRDPPTNPHPQGGGNRPPDEEKGFWEKYLHPVVDVLVEPTGPTSFKPSPLGWTLIGGVSLLAVRRVARKNPRTGARLSYSGDTFNVEAGWSLADFVAMGLLGGGIAISLADGPLPVADLLGVPMAVAGAGYFGMKLAVPDKLDVVKTKLIGQD